MPDDYFNLLASITQSAKSFGDGGVNNSHYPAANQVFHFDEGELRFNASGRAIHHEGDCTSWRNYCSLRISKAVFFAEHVCPTPNAFCFIKQSLVKDSVASDCRYCIFVFLDYPKHRLAVLFEFFKRPLFFCNLGRESVSFAGHDRSNCCSAVSCHLRIVRDAESHKHSSQVCITES